MAIAETQRIAEIKAKLSQLSQAFSVPESVGLGKLDVSIVNGVPEMVLNADTGQSQPYAEWLALQNDLASLEKLLATIEEKGIPLSGERVDIPMRLPSGPEAEQTVAEGEQRVDVPLAVPNMRRELVAATFREAEKELQQVMAKTKTVPDSLEVFTTLTGDARAAVEQMFKDPFKTGNNDERATPVYRGYKQPDGSISRGQLIVQYPPQALEAFLSGMKPELATALSADVDAITAGKGNVPDSLAAKIKMIAEQGTPEEKQSLRDVFTAKGAKLNLEGAAPTVQREEPFEAYIQKQPDNVVAPVVQQLGGAAATKTTAETPATPEADKEAAEAQAAQEAKKQEEIEKAKNTETVKLHDYTDIYDDTLKLGKKRGMHAVGFGAGVTTIAALALTTAMPAFGIGLLAFGATMVGRFVGESLGTRAAEAQALDNAMQAMIVDLAKLSPEKREEMINDELSRFGNHKCVGQLRARIDEMLEIANKLPKDKDVLNEIDRHVMERINHSRREAPVDAEHSRWMKYGTYGTLAIATTAIAAPAVVPFIVGAAGSFMPLVAAPVVGALTGATLGTSAGAVAGGIATERGAEAKLAKAHSDSLAQLDPHKRQQVLDGLSYLLPDSSLEKINRKLDEKIPERRGAASASTEVEPAPTIASPLVANQRVVEEYAQNVASENAALGSAIKSFATGRTQLQDVDDVARHIVKSAEKGEPVPGEVVEAISKLAQHANNLGAVEAIMRANEQVRNAASGRGAA